VTGPFAAGQFAAGQFAADRSLRGQFAARTVRCGTVRCGCNNIGLHSSLYIFYNQNPNNIEVLITILTILYYFNLFYSYITAFLMNINAKFKGNVKESCLTINA